MQREHSWDDMRGGKSKPLVARDLHLLMQRTSSSNSAAHKWFPIPFLSPTSARGVQGSLQLLMLKLYGSHLNY